MSAHRHRMPPWTPLIFATICLFAFVNLSFATSTNTIKVDRIVVFGDSLSDTGNTHEMLVNLNSGNWEKVPELTTGFVNLLRDILPNFDTLDQYIQITLIVNTVVYDVLQFSKGKMTIYPPEHYYHGRFSNGPAWPDYLADRTNTPLINYAYGGSWIEFYEGDVFPSDFLKITSVEQLSKLIYKLVAGKIVPPCVALQERLFFQNNPPATPNTLFLIWAGANDYINKPNNAKGVIASLEHTLKNMIVAHHVNNIVIAGLPNMGDLPRYYQTEDSELLSQLTAEHDKRLQALVMKLNTKYPDIKLIYYDARPLFQNLLDHPERYGFTDSHHACTVEIKPQSEHKTNQRDRLIAQISLRMQAPTNPNEPPPTTPQFKTCSDPNSKVFWDDIHPSSHAHQIMAETIYTELLRLGFRF